MKIIRLDVKETESGWHLKDARFDDINLLVGVSGVGKTKIVEAIRTLARIAFKSNVELIPMEWTIEFVNDNRNYCWSGKIAKRTRGPLPALLESDDYHFIKETLMLDDGAIIERSVDNLKFKGKEYPRLNKATSALSLLNGERDVQFALAAFAHLAFESGNAVQSNGFRFSNAQQKETTFQRFESAFKELTDASHNAGIPGYRYVHQVLKISSSMYPETKSETYSAHVLKMFFPEQFALITELFCEIFPSVTAVTVDTEEQLRATGDPLLLQFAIKERGCEDWILQSKISSGMLRTLLHLLAVDTAPPGSVIIIDEFENSLGENCLSHMTETLLEHVGEVQFILTSHHPYVIHNIPVDCWQLVRRHGSTVTLTSARDIPALMSESHHDAFTRLLNLKEFQDGIEIADETGKL